MSDALLFALFTALLLGIVGTGELLRARAGWRPEASRRLVHVAVGLAVVVAVACFASPLPLYVLAGGFALVNLFGMGRGWFPAMHAVERRSWGTVTFPLALVFALWACWTLDPGRVYIIQIAFAVLALADPLAAVAGTGVQRLGRFVAGPNGKSAAGSAVFFGTAALVVAAGLALARREVFHPLEIVAVALIVAAVATGAEALARGGWDNFFIVVAVVVPLVLLEGAPAATGALALGAAVALAFVPAALAARFLTLDGALAGAGLAFSVIAFGGWAWALPAFAFFLVSSLVSVVGRGRKRAAARLAAKGSRRDASQVYANGGVAWLLLVAYVFFPDATVLYWGFIGAFAAAAADTWGTEVGTLVRGRTRLIWSGLEVPPGTSGGVSVAGSAGGLLGAALVLASLLPVGGAYAPGSGLAWAVTVSLAAALLASVVDSTLGATLQAAYRDPRTGALTERVPAAGSAELARGWAWMTNDRVNLACTAVGAAIPLLALSFL